MNEKRHFKMYKHGKLWVTAVAGLGALVMGSVSIDASDKVSNTNEAVMTQVVTDASLEAPVVETTEKPAEKEVVQPAEDVTTETEKPAEKEAEQPVEDVTTETEKPAEKEAVVEEKVKPAEEKVVAPKPEAKASEKVEVKSAPKPAEKAPEKAEEVKPAPKPEAKPKPAPKPKAKPVVKNGWHGKKYYKNNKALTGRQNINGKWYLFDAKGTAKTGFQNVGKNKQYYNLKNYTMTRNGYVNLGKKGVYYFNGNGNAIRGIRKFKDSKGKLKIEAYHNKTNRQMRNAYYEIDKNKKTRSAYYLNGNGNAIRGIRKFKDSKGNLKIEAYHNKTYRQMRNAYYDIDKNKKTRSAYFLGGNGRAVKGLRQFGKNVEFYGSNYKRVSNQWKTVKNTRYYFANNGRASQVLLNYKYYSQLNQGAPQGCEGASMQIALSHKGRYVPSLKEIYRKTGSGYGVKPSKGFFGNPFGNGGKVTETIYASALAKSFKHMGAADLTGAKKGDIIRELNRGNAIVTWADYSWRLTGNHSYHVMSIVGYSNGHFLIADPYAYGHRTQWVSQNTWEYVNSNTQTLGYRSPKSMNMVIR